MMFLPTCKEVSRTLAEAAEEIPWHKALMMRVHLSMCDHCSRFQRQLRLLGDVFRTERPAPSSVGSLEDKIIERLKKG